MKKGSEAEAALAKLSLELGGKNSLIVFADCDIDTAVDGGAT